MAETFTASQGDQCIAVVKSALPQANQATLDAVADAMAVHLKYAEPGANPQKALEKAVSQVTEQIRRNIKVRKHQAYLNIAANKRVSEYIRQNFSHDVFDGLKAQMVGIASDIKGSRMAAAVQQNELLDHYLSGLTGDLQRLGILDELVGGVGDQIRGRQNTELHRAVAIELERIGQEHILPGTDNLRAKQAAEVIHKWQEKARLDANDAGANIGKLAGYISKQTHDMFRVRDMGYDKWKELIQDRLDWRKIEEDRGKIINNRDDFLKKVFNGIITGEHLKHADAAPAKTVAANVGKSLSHERVLHFKPGEWFEYNQQAGSRSVVDAVVAGLEKHATTTGLMRAWGPSAVYNMEQAVSNLKQQFPDQAPKFRQFVFDGYKGQLTGEHRIPGEGMWAKLGTTFRTLQNITKLGGSVITAAITDPMIMASELRYQGAGALDGYKVALESDLRGMGSTERRATLQALGVMMQGMSAHFHNRLDADGVMSGNMTKLNSLYFKLNLLTPHTDRLRAGAAEAMATMSAGYSKLKFNDLNAKYKRVLELFNIDETDWELMRKHGIQEHEGVRLMTPEAIDNISDDAIRAVKGNDLSARKVRMIREELRSKYHSYLIDRVDTAVLRPDQRTSAIQTFGTQAGTPVGELVRTLMQFKGFPIAFLQKVVGREIYGSGAGSLRNAMQRPDILMGMGSLMVQSTLLGYGVIAVKDILNGKEPPDFLDPDTLRESALKGGGLGFYGDILFGELKKEWGRGGVSALLGPGVSTIDDLMDVAGQFREGDPDASKILRTAYRNAVPNLFYTKMVLDYGVLYNMMEWLEPGSVRKMEKRFKTEHERDYFISPSEAVR